MSRTTIATSWFCVARRLVVNTLRIVWVGLLIAAGCTSPQLDGTSLRDTTPSASAPQADKAEALLVVDCLLPGRVKKLGRRMTFLTPRRPIKTSAQDCEIRGGEYVAFDRSDYATALKVWLPQAKEGDQEAQTYVGEIYEKGLGLQPDYAAAVAWYRKAAEQGNTRAQINLGHLYEKGLGVKRDAQQAVYWYRQASGLSEAIALDAGTIRYSGAERDVQSEMQALRQEVERWKKESTMFQQELERTRQELSQARQELNRRRSEFETEREHLQQAWQEFEQRKREAVTRDHTELQALETQLQQREAKLVQQRREVAHLEQTLAGLETKVQQRQTEIAQLQKKQEVAMVAPTIEIIDPPLVKTRGLVIARVSSTVVGKQREIVGRVVSPAGLLTLLVNDHPEQLDPQGLFRTAIPVKSREAQVNVSVVDKQGKRASVEFQLTAAAAQVAAKPKPEPVIDFGSYHALVIGNSRYTNWPSLITPEADANRAADILREQYGFNVRVLLNATRFDILQKLNAMRKELTDNDNLLIYYAGHGHWEEKIKRGYWVPTDGDLESNVNWISTVAITDILGAMSAGHILVVADSCYSGALTRSALARLEAGKSEKARQHWFKVMAEKRSRTVLSSGDLQPVLDSGGGNHSVFAKAFLDVLDNNDEVLSGQHLHSQVSAQVAYAASAELVEQNPQYAPIRFAGHESGDFIFVPKITQP